MLAASTWAVRHVRAQPSLLILLQSEVNLSAVSREQMHLFGCISSETVSFLHHLYDPVFSFQPVLFFSGECVNQMDIYKEGMVFPWN